MKGGRDGGGFGWFGEANAKGRKKRTRKEEKGREAKARGNSQRKIGFLKIMLAQPEPGQWPGHAMQGRLCRQQGLSVYGLGENISHMYFARTVAETLPWLRRPGVIQV